MDALRRAANQIGGTIGDAIRAGLSMVVTVDLDGSVVHFDFPRGNFPGGELPAEYRAILTELADLTDDNVTSGHVSDLLSEIAPGWHRDVDVVDRRARMAELPGRMAEIRMRLDARPRPRMVKADPPPIYDEIYYEGVRMLDADAADPDPGAAGNDAAGSISLSSRLLTEAAERGASEDDELHARQLERELDKEMRGDVDDLIYCAANYDDKPHQLYWRISRMAERWCRDPLSKVRARGMMEEAYETANLRTQPARDRREVHDLRAQLAAVDDILSVEHDPLSRIEALEALIDRAEEGSPDEEEK
jgi:hypothetical protein